MARGGSPVPATTPLSARAKRMLSIEGLLASNPQQQYRPAEVGALLGFPTHLAATTLADMAAANRVQRHRTNGRRSTYQHRPTKETP